MSSVNCKSTCLQKHEVLPKDVNEHNVTVMGSRSQHVIHTTLANKDQIEDN